jgi:hypothetical protein
MADTRDRARSRAAATRSVLELSSGPGASLMAEVVTVQLKCPIVQ